MASTFTGSPAVSADDGYHDNTTFNNNGASLAFGRGGTSLFYSAFIRIPNVTIPKDAIILSATMHFVASDTLTGTACNTLFKLCNENSATAPTNITTYLAKPVTTGTAITIPAYTSGNGYTTGDFKNEVQFVVNRTLWQSGNAICVMIYNNGSDNPAYRNVYTKDKTTDIPYITIQWTQDTPLVGTKYALPAFQRV